MNTFGTIKSKLLTKLTEAYTKNNKSEVKELLNTIKENKQFKELYLFYEEVENKSIEDKDTAKLFVESVESMLTNQKNEEFDNFCNSLSNKLKDVEVEKNDLYESIDQLSVKNTLANIEQKITAKKKLVEHLTSKKESVDIEKKVYTENETLLHTVLTNNFNVLYNNTLSEEEKKNLKDILVLSNEDLEIKTKELKESLNQKIEKLLVESSDTEMKSKLEKVKEEVNNKDVSRISYYRLTELKNGLD